MIISLDDIKQTIKDEWEQYHSLFDHFLLSGKSEVDMLVRYIIKVRGKEIRPLLLLLCSNLCKSISEKSLYAAIAIEMLHMATLVHDDVVDEADTRHGQNSVHKKFGNRMAILIGDYLLTLVMQIFARLRSQQLYNIIADMSNRIAKGELLQLHQQQHREMTQEDYFNIIENKTAILLASTAQIGGICGGGTMRQAQYLFNFGLNLGMCFQMKDDILDFDDDDMTGKKALNDIHTGKITLPLLIALHRATPEEKDEMETILSFMASTQPNEKHISEYEQAIRSFVLRYDGVTYTYQHIRRFQKKAFEYLHLFHNTPERERLEQLLQYVINRTS